MKHWTSDISGSSSVLRKDEEYKLLYIDVIAYDGVIEIISNVSILPRKQMITTVT